MNNKILLSIVIPTWNRARSLENLLNNILRQTRELKREVEICISDNDSTDNTREVVAGFSKKYPGLINYNKNQENLGLDINILKVIDIARGDFIWTFGDDDSIMENGLGEVVGFIKKINKKNTGLVVLRRESYFIDKQTGKKIICGGAVDKSKPAIFKLEKEDIIGMRSPLAGFMSILIFNGKILKQTIREDKGTIKRSIGTAFMCMFLRSLMFLRYPHLDAITLNKPMVLQEVPSYKFFIEDKFMLHYRVKKKINKLLLSYEYINNSCVSLIIKIDKKLRRGFVEDMIVMRAFKSFNYSSYFGCLRSFFQHALFIDALTFSLVFSMLFLIPSAILRIAYKVLLIIRHGKNWKVQWSLASTFISIAYGGTRRLNYMFHD